MEKGRLFGAALANVREPQRKGSRTVQLRSDSRTSQTSRAIMKIGGRLGNRRVIAVSDPSFFPSSNISNRRGRTHHSPHVKSSDDATWSHDMFEGDAAANPGSEVFVRNLPSSVTKQQLVRLFNAAGDVVSVKIDPGPLTTARVSFLKKNSAADAAKRFHGHKMQGSTIKVSEYQSSESLSKQNQIFDDDIMTDTRRPRRSAAGPTTGRSVLMSDAPQRSVFDRLS